MSSEARSRMSRVDETKYGLRVELQAPYETAIESITAELKKQGFGVLTSIDVRETLRKKLDREFRRYVILGACNPELAHRALQAELEVGLLLPCNVIVYEVEPGRTVVAAMAPLAVLAGLTKNESARASGASPARMRRRQREPRGWGPRGTDTVDVGSPGLENVAKEADQRLHAALEAVAESTKVTRT